MRKTCLLLLFYILLLRITRKTLRCNIVLLLMVDCVLLRKTRRARRERKALRFSFARLASWFPGAVYVS